VPEGRRRHRGAQDPARRHVLWVRELSQMRFCQQPETDQPGVSKMRQRISAGIGEREGTFLVCPNNREELPKRRKRKGAPEEAAPATPDCSYKKK